MAGSATGGLSGLRLTSADINPQTGGPTYVGPAYGGTGTGWGGSTSTTPTYTPQQSIAMQPTSGFNVNNASAQGLQASMAGAAQGMNYQPQQVGAVGYNPATLAGTNLAQYGNPFEQTVVNNLQRDAATGMQMGANQLGAQATAAKAFGGSRHGLAQGEMMSGIQNQLNNQIGQLRMGGFQNAQQMALQDAATRNQAGQYNAGNMMQAQLANQSAGLSGAQQRLGAASQLGNLSNLGFGMGQQINQQQLQQGAMQQALQQMAMDRASGQYAGYQQSPYTALSAYTQALGASPQGGGTATSTNSGPSRGLFDYLGMGLYGAGALGYRPFG